MAKGKSKKAQRKQERAELDRVTKLIRLERGLPEVPSPLSDADRQKRQAAGRRFSSDPLLEERTQRYLQAYHNDFTPEEKAAHLLMALDLLLRLERRKAAEAAQEAEDTEQAQIDQAAADLLSDVDIDL